VTLKVYDWRFRDESTEMLYYEATDPLREPAWDAGAAVGEDLTPQARVARLHEARGYYERPLAFKRRFRLCKAAARVEDVDHDTVRALRPFIEQWEPDWVEWVKREWSVYRPDIESTAYWAGVPLQATMAILDNLHGRGELGSEDA
jgi:hypothetical protein